MEIPHQKGVSAMKVAELLDALDGVDEDAEVYLANQMSYPFTYAVEGVSTSEYMVANNPDEYEDEDDEDEQLRKGVYIFEGTQLGYGPAKVSWDFPQYE